MKKNKCTRRDALKMLGATGGSVAFQRSALNILMGSVVSGIARQALAQEAGIKPRKHLFIEMVGAPPRWTFDLFLTPYSSTGFVRNPMVATSYTASGGAYTGVQYQTTKINGVNAPWLWQFDVPKAGGGSRPMAELMNNMLAIRGIDIGDFQHESAQVKLFLPPGASASLVSLAAVNSGTPIPALDVDSTRYTFRSAAPITPVHLSTNKTMLATLMDPFTNKTGATFTAKRTALATYINRALAALQDYAVSQHPGAASIFASQKGADDLLRGAVGDLTQAWSSLYGKYHDIVTRGIDVTDTIPGISDMPIGGSTRDNQYRIYDPYIIKTADMRDAFKNIYIVSLAEHFAVAEYVLLNNISGSVTIAPQQIFGCNVGGTAVDLGFDEHNMGTMVSLLTNSLYNRAFAGCMLELIDRLKAAGIFNETVIDVRGEFGRYGRTDGSGSDHEDTGGSAAFYSGIIQGPMIVGNVRNNSGPGNVGGAAPIAKLNNNVLDPDYLASSIATLLRAPSPVTAKPSILAEQNGRIVSLIEAPVQV